jgi:hypothetical protein
MHGAEAAQERGLADACLSADEHNLSAQCALDVFDRLAEHGERRCALEQVVSGRFGVRGRESHAWPILPKGDPEINRVFLIGPASDEWFDGEKDTDGPLCGYAAPVRAGTNGRPGE